VKKSAFQFMRDDQEVLRCFARRAETFGQRLRGLLGRAPLGKGQALWLNPCNSVHCFFMRYAIDVVFVDRRNYVIKIVSTLRPWRMAWCLGAESVIELHADENVARYLQLGDRLQCQD
jgi:uncharacterized membrane protein (UPF0127 family)